MFVLAVLTGCSSPAEPAAEVIRYRLLSRDVWFVKLEEGASFRVEDRVGGETQHHFVFRVEGPVCHRLVFDPEMRNEASISPMTLGERPRGDHPYGVAEDPEAFSWRLKDLDQWSDGLHRFAATGAGDYTLSLGCAPPRP